MPVRIDDPSISRSHARLVAGSDRVTVEDLDSKNGTFVNGERISRAVEVVPDDQIVFGRVGARLVLDSPGDTGIEDTDMVAGGIN